MEYYLNSCVVEEVEEIFDWGILDGVTMNPTMMAAQGGDFVETFTAICRVAPVKVFAQVVSSKAPSIVEEAKRLSALGGNVVVKIHCSVEGIKAIARLKETTDIVTCATAIHSIVEALAVAKAGADHVAVFLGLLGEADERPTSVLIQGIVEAFKECELPARVMAAGRTLQQIVDGFRAGADEMTCSYKLWKLFFQNKFTMSRWDQFESDWRSAFGNRNWITG